MAGKISSFEQQNQHVITSSNSYVSKIIPTGRFFLLHPCLSLVGEAVNSVVFIISSNISCYLSNL